MTPSVYANPDATAPSLPSWASSVLLHAAVLAVAIGFGAKAHQKITPNIPEHVMVSMVALPRAKNELPKKIMIRPPDPGQQGKIEVKPPEPERPVLPQPELAPEAGNPEDPAPPDATPPLNRSKSREEILRDLQARLPPGPETNLPSDPEGQAQPSDMANANPYGRFNPRLASYQRTVRDLIQEKWFPIESVLKENPDLIVVIGMRIDAEGRISDVQIVEASGNRSFDASAERAVKLTVTLPLPPAELQADAEKGFIVTFSATDKITP